MSSLLPLDRIAGDHHIAKENGAHRTTQQQKKAGTRGGTSNRRENFSPLGMESYVVRKISFLDGCDSTPVLPEKIRGDA
jgi:hypothetical protein